jgi:hypothetical protein
MEFRLAMKKIQSFSIIYFRRLKIMKTYRMYIFLISLLPGMFTQSIRAQLLDEDFTSGFPFSAFDQTATEGILDINNDNLVLTFTNSWDSLYITSNDSNKWDRTDGSGKVLQATFFVASLTDGGTLVTFSFIDSAGPVGNGASTGYSWFAVTNASPNEIRAVDDTTCCTGQTIQQPFNAGGGALRITVDPVQGALWEYDVGTGFVPARDNRGSAGDTATNYRLMIMNGPGNGETRVDRVLVDYVDPPGVTPDCTGTGEVLNDSFPGSSLDTGSWVSSELSGTLTVNNGLNLGGAADWNELYITTVCEFDRTNGSGEVLRGTFDMSQLSDPNTLFNCGFFPTGAGIDHELTPGHGFMIDRGSDPDTLRPMLGFNDFNGAIRMEDFASGKIRLTLDETVGALYEYDNGSGFTKIRDTRNLGGDSSASYQALLMQGPGAAGATDVSNVTLEYVTDPGGSLTTWTTLNETFPGTELDGSLWEPISLEGDIVVNDGLTLNQTNSWNSSYVASACTFGRTNGSGGVLRLTVEYISLTPNNNLVNVGLFPANTPKVDQTNMGGHAFFHNTTAGPDELRTMERWNDFSPEANAAIVADDGFQDGGAVRITLDPVAGALYEYDTADSGTFQPTRDTRVGMGRTSTESDTSYRVLLMDGPDPSGVTEFNSITVEYLGGTPSSNVSRDWQIY